MKAALKKTLILLLALSLSALLACAPPANTEVEPPQTPVPESTEPLVLPTPVWSDPEPDFEQPAEDEYSAEELNGVAGPEDALPSHESYEQAKAANPDVIGWISIEGTVIDYPVARGLDNTYYLGRNVERKKSKYGAIFMDFRNAEAYQQRHIILYGHNMKNGTMFHDLTNFKQKEFFDSHKIIRFYWDGVDSEWQVYLAYIVMPKTIYHIHARFADDQEFANIMNQTIEYAKTVKPMNYDPAVTIKPTDQVITLSTCTYEYDGSFFAVMAKRIK